MPATPQQEQRREVHEPLSSPTPVKEENEEVQTLATKARLKQLEAKLASSVQQSSAYGNRAAAELAFLRQTGDKARGVLQAASSALMAQRAATLPNLEATPASLAAAATEAPTAASGEAAAQQALEKAEKEVAAVKRERDQLSSHLAASRAAEALARRELHCLQREMQRMVAAAAEGSLAVWQGSCEGGLEGKTPLAVLLAWEVQRLEEENQVLLGQVKEMREQSAVERALARNPLQQQRAQYLETVRLERDQLRQECDAALKQRFQLEQCIRFLAARAHLPVAVRLAATGRPRQGPLAAVLPASLAECRAAAARPVPPPQRTSQQQPCSEGSSSRSQEKLHQEEIHQKLARAEQAGEESRAATGNSMTGHSGDLGATEPSTSADPAEDPANVWPNSGNCGRAGGQACNSNCQCEAVAVKGPWLSRSRASAAAKQLEAMLLGQIGVVCSRV